jgi:hypothetical protein
MACLYSLICFPFNFNFRLLVPFGEGSCLRRAKSMSPDMQQSETLSVKNALICASFTSLQAWTLAFSPTKRDVIAERGLFVALQRGSSSPGKEVLRRPAKRRFVARQRDASSPCKETLRRPAKRLFVASTQQYIPSLHIPDILFDNQ